MDKCYLVEIYVSLNFFVLVCKCVFKKVRLDVELIIIFVYVCLLDIYWWYFFFIL